MIQLTKQHLLFMGMGPRYWDATIQSLRPEQRQAVGKYPKNLEANIRSGMGLFLWGENSSGKTYVAAALCKRVWGMYRVASYMIPSTRLNECFKRDQPVDDDSQDTVISRVNRIRFLAIDDVGREYRAGSGFSESNLGALLRERSRRGQVTVITTNLTLKQFTEVYGKATSELVKEACIISHFKQGGLRKGQYVSTD